MKNEEMFNLLKETNLEVAYNHFTKTVQPPFIIYKNDSPDIFVADDIAYSINNSYIVWLVTNKKDIELENELEQLFMDKCLPFDKNEDYLESEQIYQIEYLI